MSSCNSFSANAACLAAGLFLLVACGGSHSVATGTDTLHVDLYTPDAGGAPVTSINVWPLTLIPTFSPDVQDYYIRCAAGTNDVRVSVTDSSGSSTTIDALVPDQALVIRNQYWIRCLPPDFPTITTAYPSTKMPTDGYYLLNSVPYAMVLDIRGTPVWYARGASVANVDSQETNLISLMPASTAPFGYGTTTDFELHTLGTETTTVVRASGTSTDGHELRLLPNGDYLLFTYPLKPQVDLTGLEAFGAAETLADCEIQEVDPTGQVVWSWFASDHVDAVTESIEPQENTVDGQTVIDAFHCNSIDVASNGDLLVSLRHTNAVFYVDRTTGKVVWKLGGTPISKDGAALVRVTGDPAGGFNLQHDARFRPGGNVSLFDDHGASVGVARGVEYALDHDGGTATVAWQFLGVDPSSFEGSFRRYPDGESVIGWGGSAPDPRVVTEVDSDGDDVLDISFAPTTSPYRAVKVPLSRLDIGLMRVTAGRW
jgi:hypothetical protein